MSIDYRPISLLYADSEEAVECTKVLEEGLEIQLPPTFLLNDTDPYWANFPSAQHSRVVSPGPARVMRIPNASVLLEQRSACIITNEKKLVVNLADSHADGCCGHGLLSKNIRPPNKYLDGTTLVPVGRYCYNNYWHFTTGIYALLLLAKRHNLFAEDSITKILIPSFTRNVFVEMLQLCSLPCYGQVEFVLLEEGEHVVCENLVAVGNATGWECLIPPWKFNMVRSAFMRHRNSPAQEQGKKILIVRRNTGRGFGNQDMIVSVCARHGYDAVDLEGMSFLDQAALFNRATHIVGVHGSALTNLFYAQKGVRVLELFNPFYVVNYFTSLVEAAEGIHYTLVGDGAAPNVPISSRVNDPIIFEEALFAQAMERFEA